MLDRFPKIASLAALLFGTFDPAPGVAFCGRVPDAQRTYGLMLTPPFQGDDPPDCGLWLTYRPGSYVWVATWDGRSAYDFLISYQW